MPLYEYECEGCGDRYDEVRRIESRDDLVTCSTCQGKSYRRLTTAAIHGFEEYADENLASEGSGEPFHVKSRAHRDQRRKDLGLVDPGPSDRAKDHRLELQRGRQTFLPGSLR